MQGWIQSRCKVFMVKLGMSLKKVMGEQQATLWLSEEILLSTNDNFV